uniref:Uncharacterized protein n=1 Tax=Acrobeloides nanus TaxID=290746 RepID=A0A914EC95_9BILA
MVSYRLTSPSQYICPNDTHVMALIYIDPIIYRALLYERITFAITTLTITLVFQLLSIRKYRTIMKTAPPSIKDRYRKDIQLFSNFVARRDTRPRGKTLALSGIRTLDYVTKKRYFVTALPRLVDG